MKLKPLSSSSPRWPRRRYSPRQRGKPVTDPSTDPRVGQALVANDTLAMLRGLRFLSPAANLTGYRRCRWQRWTVPDYFGLPIDFGKLVGFVNCCAT
ncbi:MAG: hypothetical protein U5N10_13715 [Gemmobacter sp.]|nr:hypothetical protein [Gemmobacter sp.]